MSVNVTSGKLPEYCEALQKIITASDEGKNNIPFEISYWAVRMLKKLKVEADTFNEQRDKLLEKFGERVVKDGVPTNQFSFNTPEKAKTFNEAIIKLAETDIVVEGISSKPMSAFGTEFKGVFSQLVILLDSLIVDDVKEIVQ